MVYLNREGLLLINRMTIDQHGGNFVPPSNILNENGLEYVIEAVKGEIVNEILFHFTMELASGKIELEGCRKWFQKNVELI